ncbi:dihydrolipoyl dehydrogenase family protein [Bosea sp. NBC_00550]|uniref:dihydrolipoyl dehydrogenase family protein n=1 Tax=Bosea sp. NBC_00550 TaxID=2969621 RepID=UPI00222E8122|nr:FAD-dependent oxidoreductase [Bosea sp. NBC_00550]UZF92278.1 FAD-dependent oxidoreductase [Bosea sp. NBC_00550]
MAKPAALTPDICVIGAGGNGIALATAAAAFGVSVVLVEREVLGGSPAPLATKALVEAAASAQAAREAGRLGLKTTDAQVSPAQLHDHIQRALAAEAANHAEERLTALGITIIRGEARFVSRSTVNVDGQPIKARRFVIATGARSPKPDLPGLDTVPLLHEEDISGLTRLPERPIILGSGATGAALAQALQRLGSKATLVAPEGLLAEHDAEAAMLVRRRLLREGLTLHDKVEPIRAERSRSGLRLVLAGGAGETVVEGSHLLLAAPQRPEIAALDLDLGGIRHDSSGVLVDKALRTSNRRVYALGGCAGGPATAVADRAGEDHVGLVLRNILFRQPTRIDPAKDPRVAWCQPEIAAIGLSEAAARAKAGTVQVLRWPFAEMGGSRAAGESEGFVKLVTDKKGRILGVTIVGEGAGELIAPWCVAAKAGLTIADMAGVVMPALSRSDASRRAALSFHVPSTNSARLRRLIGFLRRFG